MKKFSAFEPVLVRISDNAKWHADFYDQLTANDERHQCMTNVLVKDENILPYNEETKHLHGTVGEYIKWIPKKGEPILVRDTNNERWAIRIFMGMEGNYFVGITDPETPHSACSWLQAKPYTNPFEE